MRNLLDRVSWINISKTVDTGTASGTAAELSSSKLLRNIKGVIFDFDGTLFDTTRIPFYLITANPLDMLRIWRERLVRKRFADCDFSSPEKYYRAFFGVMGKTCSRSPEHMRKWYFNQYMPRMVKVLTKHYKPRLGTIELFRLLGAENSAPTASPQTLPKVAIYSDYPFLKERLAAIGLTISPNILLYGPEFFGAQKPAERPFLHIAKDFGVAPEEVLVIGDREDTDGLGAFKAGMRFFCLETGRKRYFRLDPYRQPPVKGTETPQVLMYAGAWPDLVKLFMNKYR